LHCSKVTLSAITTHRPEIQWRKFGLQTHKRGKHARYPSIPFTEWVDENQFRMYHGKGMNYISGGFASAGCVFSQDILLEIIHESGDVSSNGKGKVTLREVNLPVLPCPRVDWAKPGPVNLAYIVCRKSMAATIRVE
jgi:hypothetical protein